MSNPFAALVHFDATDTLAARVFEHVERAGASPETVFVVMRRLVNKGLARLRHDGPYFAWTVADGSQILLSRVFFVGEPWFAALPSRAAMDATYTRGWAAAPWVLLCVSVEEEAVAA